MSRGFGFGTFFYIFVLYPSIFFVMTDECLTFLGTGAAMVTSCYNTCFTLSGVGNRLFLVDGGGGNQILAQMEKAGQDVRQISCDFISHNHTDHILGLVWVVRAIAQHINKQRYEGNFRIFGSQHSLSALQTICSLLLQPKLTRFFGSRILFCPVQGGQSLDIEERSFTFFDIQSVKELQFGFSCRLLNGKKLSFLGDEPFHECCRPFVQNSDFLLQEAYCLYSQINQFNPYPKQHATALDACRNARSLDVGTTVLFHTEGRTPRSVRQQLWLDEGRQAFIGKIFVPEDLEVIPL